MYCQLGDILFDGSKSFVSFSDQEELTLVQHALINRKPKLQLTGSGLNQLTLSIFLHQKFTNVANDVAVLKAKMATAEILPLLWGNGKLEGNFVISSFGRQVSDQDTLGNIIACTINLTLLEAVIEDRLEQQQQKAKKDAFATGDKKPVVRNTTKKNPTSCNQTVADNVQAIKSNAKSVDEISRTYTATASQKSKLSNHLTKIEGYAGNLITIANTPASCANNNVQFLSAAINVKDKAGVMKQGVNSGYSKSIIAGANENLQAAIRILASASTSIIQNAITRK